MNERISRLSGLTDQEFYAGLCHRTTNYQKAYLLPSDLEDCTLGFVVKLWEIYLPELKRYRQGLLPESWLRIGAENAAKSFLRHRALHQGLEDPYPVPGEDSLEHISLEITSDALSMDSHVISNELTGRLTTALAHLSKTNRSIVMRHYIKGETWVAIAASLGRTQDGVRQKAVRALIKIKANLEADGMNAEEASGYLANMTILYSVR